MVSYFGHRRRPMIFRKTVQDEATGGASTSSTATSIRRPFDAFLTAAFTAILAVLFAWRIFFFENKKRTPSIEGSPTNSHLNSDSSDGEETVSDNMSDNEETSTTTSPKFPIKMPQVGTSPDSPKASLKSVSTLLETDSLPTSPGRPSTAPPPVPKLTSSAEELEKVLNEESAAAAEAAIEAATAAAESPPIVINTFGVQKDLEEARFREFAPDSDEKSEDVPDEWLSGAAQPDIFMFGGPGLIHFVSSTSNPSTLDPTGYGSYLDAITEEDSDDLRSQSSASSHHFGSSSAQSSVRAPSADVVGEVDARIINILNTNNDSTSTSNSSSESPREKIVEIIDSPTKSEAEVADEKEDEEEETPVLSRRESGPELLSEAEESLPESENLMFPRITAVAAATASTAAEIQKKMETDRDQSEVTIVQDKQRFTHLDPKNTDNQNDESRVSSTSVSIEFDNSRDSILDQSLCSNPTRDETILDSFGIPKLASDMDQQHQHSDQQHQHRLNVEQQQKPDDSFDEDNLPPPPLPSVPPPPLNVSTESSDGPPPPPEVLKKKVEMETIEILKKPDETSSLKEWNKPEPEEIVVDARDEETILEKQQEESKKEEQKVETPKSLPETTASKTSKIPGDLSSPERLSSLLYGYDSGGLAPLGWQYRKTATSPDEGNKENSTTKSGVTPETTNYKFGDPVSSSILTRPLITDSSYSYSSSPMYTVEERTTFKRETFGNPYDVDLERSSRRLARYGQTYADAPLSYMSNADAREMEMPHHSEAPPPPLSQPQTQRTAYAESTGYRTDADTSRDDLMSDAGRRSRATVREIPVHRSQSAFSYSRAPTTTNGSMLDFKTPGAGGTGWTTTRYEAGNPGGEEYYRREVMTRTLVTRSTEALSQQPLPIAPPVEVFHHHPEPRDEITQEYITKYSRSVEEEERRIRDTQERRRQEEEERRRREEEIRRRFEQEENERLSRIRMERMRIEKDLEEQILQRERIEREKIERERVDREEEERRRRAEWERLENQRRAMEEEELARRREREKLEKEKLERQQMEAERIERERLARERAEIERIERERMERERIERERIEIERLEIERIERIKREQREREQRDRERERLEIERIEKERIEAERLERERIERERMERELIEQQRREAEQREKERRQDEMREALRREQEARERELIEKAEREAAEREHQRRLQEKLEWERLERLRAEQERLEREKEDAARRERERLEEERRELELLEAKVIADKRREQERLDEERREMERREQERREREKRERERMEAAERERLRRLEEQREQERLAELERKAAERRAIQAMEGQRARERDELERERLRLIEIEKLEADRREKERETSRLAEERRLAELREQERRNAALREQERQEAARREANRQRDDRRSRERLDLIVKEREDREKMEWERRRHLAEKEAELKRKKDLTSKETLERLTRKPYYSRENLSNLSGPEVTTKVERQVIERVDRTLYTDNGPLTSTSYYTGGGSSINPPLSLEAPTDEFGLGRDRLFQSRNDDFRDSKRASRYKSRLDKDKARRDFFSADSSQNDEIERLRKSNEDLARKIEYRGPLLSKFNSSGTRPLDSGPYPSVGPSPYDKEFQELFEKAERQLAHYRKRTHSADPRPRYWSTKNHHHSSSQHQQQQQQQNNSNISPERPLDSEDINRSKSVLDYNATVTTQQESSTRRGWYSPKAEGNHTRSKSADMLMDQKAREIAAAPENELQKQGGVDDVQQQQPISEYEHRFRKSVEKMHVPDWYRDYSSRQQQQQTSTTTTTQTRYDLPPSQPWSYTSSSQPPPLSSQSHQPHYQQHQSQQQRQHHSTSPPVGGISFPAGMFDKYKDEIEDMRRSRTSLHQIGQSQQEHTKGGSGGSDLLIPSGTAAITREVSQETLLRRKETVTSSASGKHLPGYTVSTIPTDWNLGRDGNSRVIEVADTFIGKQTTTEQTQKVLRYGGRITVEEVLDGIFQQTKASDIPSDPSLPQSDRPPTENLDGPGIYTSNYMLMDKVIQQPHLAEDLLNQEQLFVRCGRCHKTKGIREARGYFVSCKHCYTYYCSRQCRQLDWSRHRERCSFARINTLCKEVIMKVRQDAETQYHMSRVARDGYKNYGRGSVNIRLHSAHAAQQYLAKGWKSFETMDHSKLLFYYPVQALIDQGKEQSLITLCRKYNPSDKFILSVSIIADIEFCPETPPPEPYQQTQHYQQQQHHKSPYTTQTADMYSALVPTDV